MKHHLCTEGQRTGLISAFYSQKAVQRLFQPEPGCSDPTFSGSTADVVALAARALNLALAKKGAAETPTGIVQATLQPPLALDISPMVEVRAGEFRVRISDSVLREARAWVQSNNRIRSTAHETGGLLWGIWDDAVHAIWIFGASGPPPDSLHDPGHFVCGTKGTVEEHRYRSARTCGTGGFIGFWHTHPDMPVGQSTTDIRAMSMLVSSMGQNQKRGLMLIFGRSGRRPSVGAYIYESQGVSRNAEFVTVGGAEMILKTAVV